MAKKQTVLVIEDEPHLVEELVVALVAEGFQVKTASDGETGLKLFRKELPNVVILDLILPKVDGFQILEQVKKDPKTAPIPVIVLSNLETSESIERAVRLGASSYLVKPNYELKHIVEKVKNAVRT